MKQSLQALNYFFPPEFVASLSPDDSEGSFLYRLLHEQRSKAKVWRQGINDCLELALRHKLVDDDLEARLRGGHWETFTAAVNELKCAKLLEGFFGIDSLHWHPQGRERKIGEFELASIDLKEPIFVEVKTIFPRELEGLEERIKTKLSHCAKQVLQPFTISVQIEGVGESENFSEKKVKRFLEKELGKINVGDMKQIIRLPDYKDDNTGLHLRVAVHPIPPDKRQRSCRIGGICGEARFMKTDDYARHSLGKAYEQLPRVKRPCLVILCSPTHLVDEYDMLNALFGTLSVRFYQRSDGSMTEPEPFRGPDGFPHAQQNRQLSAVGVYEEKFSGKGIESNFSIYHNPWAANPLDYSIFASKGVRQLAKAKDGKMKWID